MRNKLSYLLLSAWSFIITMATLTWPAFAANPGEYTVSALLSDPCEFAVILAIGFLVIGSIAVLIVIHKKRNR